MNQEIKTYYDNLAVKYDVDRFSNSYGEYIHTQEYKVLNKYLDKNEIAENLDMACGTGRFLTFSDYGIDISPEMVKVAKKKYPSKTLFVGDAEQLPFKDSFFSNVTSFHLLMHLEPENLENIFKEAHRVVKKNGQFIFDVPSQKRRKLVGYKNDSWHGANQASVNSIKTMMHKDWELVAYHGIAFFPIHRIPKLLRKPIIRLDNLLCNSFLREYSSYIIFILRKK